MWFGMTGKMCVAARLRACKCAVVAEWTAPHRMMSGSGRLDEEEGFTRWTSEVAIWDCAVRMSRSVWIEGGVGWVLIEAMRSRRRLRICESFVVFLLVPLELIGLLAPLLEELMEWFASISQFPNIHTSVSGLHPRSTKAQNHGPPS